MKKLQFLLLCFCLANFMSAQVDNWKMSGWALNATGEPLSGATVFLDGKMKEITSESGRFYCETENKPSVLLVRLVGYQTFKILLDTLRWENGKLDISVVLRSSDLTMDEVLVSAKQTKIVFKENYSMDLLDFKLVNPDLLLLLLRVNRKNILRLTTEEGMVLSELKLPPGVSSTFLDQCCTGTYHVVSQHWAWELIVKPGEIDTLGRYPAADFYKYVDPCQALVDGAYFFRKTGDFGQSIRYTWVDPSGGVHGLAYIVDQDVLKKAGQILSDFRNRTPFMAPRSYELDPSGAFNVQQVEHYLERLPNQENSRGNGEISAMDYYSDDQMAYLSTLEMVRRDSLYAPMFVIGDTIYLFNHPQNTLLRFRLSHSSSGVELLVRENTIKYHLEKNWKKQILVDDYLRRFYGRFQMFNKGLTIKEVDIETGIAKRTYSISDAPYLTKKHQIRNGSLFFMGQPDVTIPNLILYKVDVFQYKAN